MDYRKYSVSRRDKQPLLDFILVALRSSGCRILHHSDAAEAPFRITFEAPDGERIGIIVYAFFANRRITRNRPENEHRFQVKYGPKTSELHALWQDPFELYTTLFLGINPEQGFFVAACLHPRTERWEFRYALTADLDPHDKCQGRMSNRVRLDERWSTDPLPVLERALSL